MRRHIEENRPPRSSRSILVSNSLVSSIDLAFEKRFALVYCLASIKRLTFIYIYGHAPPDPYSFAVLKLLTSCPRKTRKRN